MEELQLKMANKSAYKEKASISRINLSELTQH